MMRADGDRRERPHKRVVYRALRVPPLFEAGRAPRAGAFLEVQAWEHLGPGQHRQEPQVASAGQNLQPLHEVACQRARAVQSTSLIAPEGHEEVRVAVICQVRAPDEGEQLVHHELAHTDAVRLGETADVAGQALGFGGADANRLQAVEPATRRDRRPRELPLRVDRRSVSAYRRVTPLPPDPVSDGGRPV